MKTLRFFGMALLAVALSVNFTACSDDDGDDDSGSTTYPNNGEDDDSSSDDGKRLSAIVYDSSTDSLLYDKQGRLTEVRYISPNELFIITFEYEEDSIIRTDNDGGRTVYTLNTDGNIVKSVDYNYGIAYATAQYTYNANEQLTNILRISEDNDPVQTELTWSDDCIAQVNFNDGAYTTYTYNSTPSFKGWIVFNDDFAIGVFLPASTCWLANAGYFGKVPAYLISEIHSESGYGGSCQITYEYDDDGYVSKITKINNYRSYSVTLTWE